MNEPTPLSPETVDALLSADLDGDLEAAARDLGLSAAEARTRLKATPGTDARRVALTRARDLLASRPPVEASVEDRLIAAAMATDDLAAVRARRGKRERQWRVLVAAGSVAAAVAVIVGVTSMQRSGHSNAKSSGKAVSSPTQHDTVGAEKGTAPRALTNDNQAKLGDVTRAQALRAPALQLLARASRKPASGSYQTTTGQKSVGSAPQPVDTPGSPALQDSSFATRAAPACTATRLRRYDITARPALIARGTVAGAPVLILLYDGAGHPYAYVIRVRDCSLVRKQPLR